jgi:protein-S-isoprenylcysteine O-methyltransferase Ste14
VLTLFHIVVAPLADPNGRTPPRRLRIGQWLNRHRVWGLVPLLIIGLFTHIGAFSVRTGSLMMIAGGVGIFSGTLLRIICRTFVRPEHDATPLDIALITDGPFAISRNPIYLAEAAIALGIAMMSRMPWLVVTTLLTGLAMYGLIIEWQEERFRAALPTAYAVYSRLVPRWFSVRTLLDGESYVKSRGRVGLLAAVRGESLTLLVALVAILAFIAKANLELYF